MFARTFGDGEICAVNNVNHVLRAHWRHRNVVKTVLDVCWLEMGHVANGCRYRLPAELPRKAIKEVPSYKRSMYRKRFALEAAIEAAMRSYIASIALTLRTTR